MCVDICAGMCAGMCADMCADMSADMCADMSADMCADICADMCADICADMWVDGPCPYRLSVIVEHQDASASDMPSAMPMHKGEGRRRCRYAKVRAVGDADMQR